MKNYKLISAIIGKQWIIDPGFAIAHLPVVASLLKGESPIYAGKKNKNQSGKAAREIEVLCFAANSGTFKAEKYTSFDQAPAGSIAVHDISGPILKADYCGDPGSETMGMLVKQADASPNIIAHILKSDTPGGQVDGTPTFADIIDNTQKPVITFVTGMLCSAGYWMAAPSDEIIASEETNTIGSIGVYTSLTDYSKYYEELGINKMDIYAPQSTEKNKGYRDAIKGDTSTLEESLGETADSFISAVKKYRGDKINLKAGNPFKGDTYNAQNSIKIGLIDSMGNFDFAVQRAKALADQRNTSVNIQSQFNKSDMKLSIKTAMVSLMALFGLTATAGKDTVEFDASEESLAKLDLELKAGSEAKAALLVAKQDLEKVNAEKAELERSLATANVKLDKKRAKIEALKAELAAGPGASPSPAVKNDKSEAEGQEKSKNETPWFDPNAEHNKTAAEVQAKAK